MSKASSSPSSHSSKAIAIAGLALLGSSLAMGGYNCASSDVDHDNLYKEGQIEPARSAIGVLLGVDTADRCHSVAWAIPSMTIDHNGKKRSKYSMSATLECDWREVRVMGSGQEFHRPKTVKEKVATHTGNVSSGIMGAGIAAMGLVSIVRNRMRRKAI